MKTEWKNRTGFAGGRAFTLIELLVVVAIIAILISILLPSLNAARNQAKAVRCAANNRQVGQSMHAYLAENNAVFPPSYIYANDANGGYDLNNQDPAHPFGYIHWSWFLYNRGQVQNEAFTCPMMENGGVPRTNPGKEARNWEPTQVDQNGQSGNGTLEDKQAPRMSFTGNAAIFPRNKFTQVLSGGPRVNKLASESKVRRPGNVILLTEFNKNWIGAAIQDGSGYLSKSHRSVNPFWNIGSGANEYAAPLNTPGFTYGEKPDYGVQPLNAVTDVAGLIEGSVGTEINAVGRHHPGGDKYGGTANFLYMDGHCERTTIFETMKNRRWGDAYYSLTGRNEIIGIE